MSDSQIASIPMYIPIRVNNRSFDDIANEYGTTAEEIKRINPSFSDVNTDEKMSFTIVYVPNHFRTAGISGNTAIRITTNIFKPVIDVITSKLYEVLYRIQTFDEDVRTLTNEINKEKEIIYTTENVLWEITADTFKDADQDAYIRYQKDVFEKYEQSICSLGFFFRHMTYLHHFIHHREYFEIRRPDKIGDAFNFTDKILDKLLDSIDRMLFYVFHEFQMLNGSPQDWVIYQTIGRIIDASFGEINKYFSKKGEVNWYTLHGQTFFSYNAVLSYTGERINDECIFDYKTDYKSLSESHTEINAIFDTINTELNKVFDGIETETEGMLSEAQILYTGHFLPQLTTLFDNSQKGLEDFLAQNRRARSIYNDDSETVFRDFGIGPSIAPSMGMAIERIPGMKHSLIPIYDKAKSTLTHTESLFQRKSTWDMELEDAVEKAALHFYCFHLSLVLFYIAGQVKQGIGSIESWFINEEALFDDIRTRLEEIHTILDDTNIQKAKNDFLALQETLPYYYEQAEKYIKQGAYVGVAVDIAFIVVLTVTVFITGSLISGALAPIAAVTSSTSTSLVTTVTIVSQAALFTVGPELFRMLNRGTTMFDGSFSRFALTFVFNVVMIKFFRFLSDFFQKLIALTSVKNSVGLFFMNWTANFITSTLVTFPAFAFHLISSEKKPSVRDEWLKFLLTNAVLSGVFTLSSKVMFEIQKKIALFAADRSMTAYTRYLNRQYNRLRPNIERNTRELQQHLQNIKKQYPSSTISRNEDAFNNLKNTLRTAIDKPKAVLTVLKTMQRDLIRLEARMGKQSGSFNPAPNGELVIIEQSISQMETWLSEAVFVRDLHYPIATVVHNKLPNNTINGLRTPGTDHLVYLGKLRVLLTNAEQIRSITMEGSPLRMVNSRARAFFPQTKSLEIEAKSESGQVTSITVVDSEGRTDMTQFRPDERYPVPEIETTLPALNQRSFDIFTASVNRFNAFSNASFDEVKTLITEGMPLSEYERNLYMELLNSGRVRSTWLCRIQGGSIAGPYEFRQFPVVFVADLFFLQGVTDQVTAKILIGYIQSWAKPEAHDRLLIFKNNPANVIQSNITNIRNAFNELVRWVKDRPPNEVTGRSLERFNYFKRDYRKYFIDSEDKDKYLTGDMNKLWEEFGKLEPSEEKIIKLEEAAIAKEKTIEDDPLWALATLLNDYLSVNPLWTGKGYTWTYTNRFGLQEYLLEGPIQINSLKINNELEIIPLNELIPEGDIQ